MKIAAYFLCFPAVVSVAVLVGIGAGDVVNAVTSPAKSDISFHLTDEDTRFVAANSDGMLSAEETNKLVEWLNSDAKVQALLAKRYPEKK